MIEKTLRNRKANAITRGKIRVREERKAEVRWQDQLDRLTSDWQDRFDALIKSHEAEKEDMRRTHRKEIARLNKDHEADLRQTSKKAANAAANFSRKEERLEEVIAVQEDILKVLNQHLDQAAIIANHEDAILEEILKKLALFVSKQEEFSKLKGEIHTYIQEHRKIN